MLKVWVARDGGSWKEMRLVAIVSGTALLVGNDYANTIEVSVEHVSFVDPHKQLSRRWAFEFKPGVAHTEVVVRVGQPGSRALAGKLMLRPEEAEQLSAYLEESSATKIVWDEDFVE